jgi:signal transduction histidine kinase
LRLRFTDYGFYLCLKRGSVRIFVLFFIICYTLLSSTVVCAKEDDPMFERIAVIEEDKDHSLSFAQVLERKEWKVIDSTIFSGAFTKNAHWLKLTIDPKKNDSLFLTVLFTRLNDVRLYVPDALFDAHTKNPPISTAVPNWQYYQQGNNVDFGLRELNWRGFSFALHSNDNLPHDVYLRVLSRSSHLIYPQIWKKNDFYEYQRIELLIYGYFLGLATLFLFLALILFYFIRTRLHVTYIMFVLTGVFYILFASSFLQQWISYNPPIGLCASLMQISSVAVLREMLNKSFMLIYWIQTLFMFSGLVAFCYSILEFYGEIAFIFILFNLISIILSALISFVMWRKKFIDGSVCLTYLIVCLNYMITALVLFGMQAPIFLMLYPTELGIFFNFIALLIVPLKNAYQHFQVHEKSVYLAQLQAQASKSQRHWLTMVTHEIKTPLSIIKGCCQNMELINRQTIMESRIDKIKINVSQIDTLIHRFLNNDEVLDRLNYLKKTALNLDIWLPEQLRFFDEEAQKRWDLNIQPNVIIFADPSLLAIALNNLLTNSLKYSLTSSTIEITCQPSKRQNQKGVLLSVSDCGEPIDNDKRDFLFGRYQLNEYAGNGIGLWACREIARAHDGDVWLESKITKVNQFNIWLPVKGIS